MSLVGRNTYITRSDSEQFSGREVAAPCSHGALRMSFTYLTTAVRVCAAPIESGGSDMHARIEDRIEIESLMKRYCLFFDTKRPDDLALLFSAEAVIDYGPEVEPIRGRDRLREMVASGLASRFESTNHQISNELITFTGEDSAIGTSHLYAWHKYFDSEVIGHLYGGYRYSFVKESEGWRIADLKLYASGSDGFHRKRMHDFRTILSDEGSNQRT